MKSMKQEFLVDHIFDSSQCHLHTKFIIHKKRDVCEQSDLWQIGLPLGQAYGFKMKDNCVFACHNDKVG